jgi:peptide/nickel transport system ATP-binding protein
MTLAQNTSLLEIEHLQTVFHTPSGAIRAVDDLSFSINSGETVCIVGESGSGKSVASMSILRLLPTPPAKITGKAIFKGRDLFSITEKEMREVRGNKISMVFQEPMTSLNPVLTVGRQIAETVKTHEGLGVRQAFARAQDMLALVGIPEPAKRVQQYPHQMSGGMRQRVMIAMALACNPELLIADEPTTALDVTIQAQILDLMRDLKAKTNAAIVLITHDLGVVAEMAQRVIVMYAGAIVEEAPVQALFADPQHPYTKGLLGAVPKLGASLELPVRQKLIEIPGIVPKRTTSDTGCSFEGRCPIASSICKQSTPKLTAIGPDHRVACYNVTAPHAA